MTPVEGSAADPSITTPLGMCCQQCRHPGDDVRLVNYPILFTLLTFQFRFELKGHWCRLHRTLRLILAGFLTSILGWLGFPFCIIATPRALFGLANGAGIHKGNNARMLRGFSEIQETQGDLHGAVRSMETSFLYLDDLWGRQELRRLNALHPSRRTGQASLAAAILAPLGLLLFALVMGNLAGLADYFWMDLVGLLRFPLLDVLLGWLVLSGFGVPAVLLLRELTQRVISRHRLPRPVYNLALGLATALLFAIGLLAGRALGNFAGVMWNNPTRLPGSALITATAAGLTRGWLLEVDRFLSVRDTWQAVHLAYFVSLVVYALYAGITAAREITRWRERLAEINQVEAPERPTLAPGWAALLLILALVGLSSAAVPQVARVDFVEARDAFNRGMTLEVSQRYDEAMEQFDRAVQLDPYMAEAYEELAWVYYQKGDAPEAIAQSLRSIEVNPNRASIHYSLGNIYYFEDDNDKAYREFEKAIVLNPGYYDAYVGSGWSAYAQGDLTRAELSFLKALNHNSRPYDAYIGLGKIYEDRGKTAQAIETYQKANQTDVTSPAADLYLGLAYLKRNNLDRAISHLENAVVKDPSNRMARTYLLMSYINAGRFEDALRAGSDSVDRYPRRAGLRALLATALLALDRPEEARLQVEQALSAGDKSDLDYVFLIHALMRMGRYQDAERESSLAVAANPEKGDFYLDLSAARLSLENYAGALEACDQAEKTSVRPVDVLLQRARIYLADEQLDLSLEQLQQAQILDPENPQVHTLLGRVYYEQNNLELALEETRKAVDLDSYNLDGLINLGFVLLETGNGPEAIKSGARAALLSPDLDVPHFILGMGYLSTGQDSAAFNELNRYLQLAQTSRASQSMRDQAEKALESLRRTY